MWTRLYTRDCGGVCFLDTQVSLAPSHVSWLVTLSDFHSLVSNGPSNQINQKTRCIFSSSNFASGRTLPTQSTGPQPIQLVPNHCFYMIILSCIEIVRFFYFFTLSLIQVGPTGATIYMFFWSNSKCLKNIISYLGMSVQMVWGGLVRNDMVIAMMGQCECACLMIPNNVDTAA